MKAIVLAGGSGTRLWPLSREDFPKQFLKFNNDHSLLQKTVKRLLSFLAPSDIVIITNEKYKFHVIDDLKGLPDAILDNMVLEPAAKNTAAAIALAMRYCEEKLKCDGDEVLLVCPSDHIISPDDEFESRVLKASYAAAGDYLVTFGVTPTRPETGYGYLKIKGGLKGQIGDFFVVEKFTEKPDEDTAKKYISDGAYLWNSGIFAFRIGAMRAELTKHAPLISAIMGRTLDAMLEGFSSMPDISIDYAVLERSERVATIPLDLYWNDVGSWDSLYEVLKQDGNGNVRIGDVLVRNTKDTMIIGSKRIISAIGLENILIVETPDALLVTKRGEAQKVKEIVKDLKNIGRKEPVESTTVYRPWGNYTVLEEGPRYKIKRIAVNPGARLSLQMHHHRSEHWVVVKGTARIIVGGKELFIHENESAYVPKSTFHMLENPGKVPLEIIEVQNGEHVGEDDIVRADDIYGRT